MITDWTDLPVWSENYYRCTVTTGIKFSINGHLGLFLLVKNFCSCGGQVWHIGLYLYMHGIDENTCGFDVSMLLKPFSKFFEYKVWNTKDVSCNIYVQIIGFSP